MQGKFGMLRSISKKLDQIAFSMEKFKFVDYMDLLNNPRRLLLTNFIGGLARGFGMAVGFTVLGAIAVYILQQVVLWKLPVIGEFISEIVEIVLDNQNKAR